MKADFNDYYPRVPGDADDADDRDVTAAEQPQADSAARADADAHAEGHKTLRFPHPPKSIAQLSSAAKTVIQSASKVDVESIEVVDDEFVTSPIPNDGIIDDNDAEMAEPAGFTTLLSNLISWILVPMLVPVYATMMIFGLSVLNAAPILSQYVFVGVVFLFVAVVPTILVLILKRMGIVRDLGLNGRRERMIPYLIMIAGFGALSWFFADKGAPKWMVMFYAGGGLAAVVNMIVNFRWKISAHAASVAGVVAMLVVLNNVGMPIHNMTWWIVGSILLSGLLGSARVWLGRHTLMQVLCGYAVGFCSVFFLSTLL